MDFFFWRKNRAIDTFANGLADEFYSQVLPKVAEDYFLGGSKQKDSNKKDNKLHTRIESALNNTVNQLDFFRHANGLGVYGKARIHLSFTERLKELGYADKLARRINEILLLRTP